MLVVVFFNFGSSRLRIHAHQCVLCVCVCVHGSELSLIPPNLPFTHILPSTLLSSVSRSGLVPAVPQQQWEPRGCLSAEMVGLLCSALFCSALLTQWSLSDCSSVRARLLSESRSSLLHLPFTIISVKLMFFFVFFFFFGPTEIAQSPDPGLCF